MSQDAVRHGSLTLSGLWARASAGQAANGAAYLLITNDSAEPDRLVSASTPAASRIELHEHAMEAGMMRMREVAGGIPVPAKGTALLAPGGTHVMLIGLVRPLAAGESFPLTLIFERAGRVDLTVPVRPIGGGAPSQGGGHSHGHSHGDRSGRD